MIEYIDKQAVIDAIESVPAGNWSSKRYVGEIERILPTDFRPVVRGRWIHFYLDSDRYVEVKCSVCRKHFTVDIVRSCGIGVVEGDLRYCPNCGADMRETKE